MDDHLGRLDLAHVDILAVRVQLGRVHMRVHRVASEAARPWPARMARMVRMVRARLGLERSRHIREDLDDWLVVGRGIVVVVMSHVQRLLTLTRCIA